jgi:hypothetical protein
MLADVPGVVQPTLPNPCVFEQPLPVVIVRVRAQRTTERLGEHVVQLDPLVAGRFTLPLLRAAVCPEHGDQRAG